MHPVLLDCVTPEDGGSFCLRNVGNSSVNETVSHSGRLQFRQHRCVTLYLGLLDPHKSPPEIYCHVHDSLRLIFSFQINSVHTSILKNPFNLRPSL